jgi:hypothetical protein
MKSPELSDPRYGSYRNCVPAFTKDFASRLEYTFGLENRLRFDISFAAGLADAH